MMIMAANKQTAAFIDNKIDYSFEQDMKNGGTTKYSQI